MLTLRSSSCFSDSNIQHRMVSPPALKSHPCPESGERRVLPNQAPRVQPAPGIIRHCSVLVYLTFLHCYWQ